MLRRAGGRRPARGQRGQAILLFALMLPVLLGFVGLAADYGRLLVKRRELQDTADAAALAGVVDLTSAPTTACTDANNYLIKNDPVDYPAATYTASQNSPVTCSTSSPSGSCPLTGGASSKMTICKTDNSGDTIVVTLAQNLTLLFMPILHISTGTVSATAPAANEAGQSVSQCQVTATPGNCFPYMVWATYGSGCTKIATTLPPGGVVLFRDNSFTSDQDATSCGWNGNSNNEKGFIRSICGNCGSPEPTNWDPSCGSGCLSEGPDPNSNSDIPNTAKGGNACGQEPISELEAAFNSDTPIWLPVVDLESGNGSNLNFHVVQFVEVTLNFTYPSAAVDPYSVAYYNPGGPNDVGDYPSGCGSEPFWGEIVSFSASPPPGSVTTTTGCTGILTCTGQTKLLP
jgi:Flp pilus assembly protein TadG